MKDVYTKQRILWVRSQQRKQYFIDRALDLCVIVALAVAYYATVQS
jgi:hypothetical protein